MAGQYLDDLDLNGNHVIEFCLENLSADPIGSRGRIFLRSDLGVIRFSPDGTIFRDLVTPTDVDTLIAGKADTSTVHNALALKANIADVNTALGLKVNTETYTAGLGLKADATALASGLAGKVDANTYTTGLAGKTSPSDVETLIAGKADTATVNTALAAKVDSSAYTAALALKADATALTLGLAGKVDAATYNAAIALKADTTALASGLAGKTSPADVSTQIATALATPGEIGSVTPNTIKGTSGQFVASAASTIPLRLDEAASQSANVFEHRNSAGNLYTALNRIALGISNDGVPVSRLIFNNPSNGGNNIAGAVDFQFAGTTYARILSKVVSGGNSTQLEFHTANAGALALHLTLDRYGGLGATAVQASGYAHSFSNASGSNAVQKVLSVDAGGSTGASFSPRLGFRTIANTGVDYPESGTITVYKNDYLAATFTTEMRFGVVTNTVFAEKLTISGTAITATSRLDAVGASTTDGIVITSDSVGGVNPPTLLFARNSSTNPSNRQARLRIAAFVNNSDFSGMALSSYAFTPYSGYFFVVGEKTAISNAFGQKFANAADGVPAAYLPGQMGALEFVVGKDTDSASLTIGGTIRSGQKNVLVTNVAGSNLTVQAGGGNGSAAPGDLIFQTAVAQASGTTIQPQATRLTIKGDTGLLTAAGAVVVADTSPATNITSGALRVAGGMSVVGNTWYGGLISAPGLTILSTGTLQTTGVGNGSVVGNARDPSAIDLQTLRTNATQVASGTNAVLCGGISNTVDGSGATVVGGGNNRAGGVQAFIGGGSQNNANGSTSVIGGGYLNSAGANYTTVGGGFNNNASALGAVIAGGYSSNASAPYSAVLGGSYTRATRYGQFAHSAGYIANIGDAQYSLMILRGQTTSAATTELFLDGASQRIILASNTSIAYDICIHAHGVTDRSKQGTWFRRGTVFRLGTAATTALLPNETQENQVTAGLAWTVAILADTTNGSLKITVTGDATNTINWVASVQAVEVAG